MSKILPSLGFGYYLLRTRIEIIYYQVFKRQSFNITYLNGYHFILPNRPNYRQNFYEFWHTDTFPMAPTFYISPPARHVNISIASHLNIYTYDYDFFITYPLSFCPPTLVASQDISLSLSLYLER